jgi:hypothetical protein
LQDGAEERPSEGARQADEQQDDWEARVVPRPRPEEETTECGGLSRRDERDAQSEKDRGDTEPYRSPKTKL